MLHVVDLLLTGTKKTLWFIKHDIKYPEGSFFIIGSSVRRSNWSDSSVEL